MFVKTDPQTTSTRTMDEQRRLVVPRWQGAMVVVVDTTYGKCVCVVERQGGRIEFPSHGPDAEDDDMKNDPGEEYSPKMLLHAKVAWEMITGLSAAGIGLLDDFPTGPTEGVRQSNRIHYYMGRWEPPDSDDEACHFTHHEDREQPRPVSYTHLTLPTRDEG